MIGPLIKYVESSSRLMYSRCSAAFFDRRLYEFPISISLVATESIHHLQTVALRVEEENYARLRLVRLQAREKELRDDVSCLQEKLAAEQRSFTHTTNQQVRCVRTWREGKIEYLLNFLII
jgi:hypothetical protein